MTGRKKENKNIESVIFNPDDLQIDDHVVISALEEKSFQYGMLLGLESAPDLTVHITKIIREILEFLYGGCSYDTIGIYERKSRNLSVFPLYKITPSYERNILKRSGECLKKKKEKISLVIKESRDVTEDRDEKTAVYGIKSCLCFEIGFPHEPFGMALIFSRDPLMEEKVNKTQLQTVLSHVCKVIIKVSSIVRNDQQKTVNIIEDMTEGVILFKEGKEMTIINTAAKKILGLPRKGGIDKATKDFITMIFLSLLKEFQTSGAPAEREIKISFPVEKILKMNITPTGENQKDALIVIRDITQFKEVERLKNDIISTVSHELRTPLTSIDGMVENMRKGILGDFNERQRDYLDRIKANIKRLASLINNFLDISKLEAGKITLIKDFYRIETLFDNVRRLLEQQMQDKKIEFRKDMPSQEVFAYYDMERMEQVFINLVYNALKFTHAGGTIMVKAYPAERGLLRLDVVDTGVGIEKDEFSRVFEKFSQLGRTYGAGEKGTGLGLAICKKIVEMHGGKISVKSPPDIKEWEKGSQFIVELPMKAEEELLSDIISESADNAAKQDNEFSVADIRLRQGTGEEDVAKLAASLKENIKQSTDIIFHFPKSNKIYIIIHCKNKDAYGISRRIKRLVGEKADKLKLYGYPKDFLDREDFASLRKKHE
jgi:two-component system, OmpR family, phosphate regulon sensor histidine kinase PhoR